METELDVAIAAAKAGGDILKTQFRRGGLDRIHKGLHDFATSADLASEAAIREVLARESKWPVYGEEKGWDRAETPSAGRAWYVDPLCGTMNFSSGIGMFCVNVGLVVDGKPVLGAVCDPVTGEVFAAAAGPKPGEVAISSEGAVEHAAPSAQSGLVDLDFGKPRLGKRNYRTFEMALLPAFSDRFYPTLLGSTLAVAYVATGRLAAFVDDAAEGAVHLAAGVALCLASGCVVSDIAGNPWNTAARGVIAAADQEVHAQLLKWSRELDL